MIPFPFILSTYAKRAALADVLRDQKQTSRADDELNNAREELYEQLEAALEAQGQYDQATVQLASSPA